MTQQETMRLALESLNRCIARHYDLAEDTNIGDSIEALKAALAQPGAPQPDDGVSLARVNAGLAAVARCIGPQCTRAMNKAMMELYAGAAPAAQPIPLAATCHCACVVQEGQVTELCKMHSKLVSPAAQPDARKVIEQMVRALEIAERHLAYVEITEAREAGQQWLEENK